MTVRRWIITALTMLVGLAVVAGSSGAETPTIDTPRGAPNPAKFPNLERDCGSPRGRAPIPADPNGASPSDPNPIAGDKFFVDPTEPSYKDMKRYDRRGKAKSAKAMQNLALQPKARWMGRYTRPNFQRKVQNYINCVQVFQPGGTPLIVVQRTQGKRCNAGYQGGGVSEDRKTVQWYRDFAEAVGNRRVVLAFEPDSIGTISCLAKSRRASRKEILKDGVDILSKLPNATIYLEGTASDWKSPDFTARMLRYIGISKVRGFMLNATHYDWTENNIAYGRKVSKKVGGKPFVINTSYNGRGPVHYKLGKKYRYKRVNVYCNPRYRGLGPKPNTATGKDKVDGYLWINRPGISGAGNCNGGFKAGEWWPSRALMFATYATERLGPAKGTKNGFKRRISRCALGAPIKGLNGYSSVSPEKRCGKKKRR